MRELEKGALETRHEELSAFLETAIAGSVSGLAMDVREEVEATLRAALRLRQARTVIAECDGLVGIVTGRGSATGTAFIRWVAVEPAARRRGIGSALVARFAEAVQRPAIQGMVNVDDPVAEAFWTSRGWRPELPGSRMWARTYDAHDGTSR